MKDTKYPANQGWVKGKLNIEPGTQLSQAQVVKFCTGGNPDDYEVPEFKHFKTVIRIVFRRKRVETVQQ